VKVQKANLFSLALLAVALTAAGQSGPGLGGPLRLQEVERLLREESFKTERAQREALQREQQMRNEQRRQTQRALEVERSNPRAMRAMEALTGEGYRGERRTEGVVQTERRTGVGGRPQNEGGNEKRRPLDLSKETMFERNGRFQEGSLVQREVEKARQSRAEAVGQGTGGIERSRTPTTTKVEGAPRLLNTERRTERPLERPRPVEPKPHR
jgi:hypothetical protein